jgi:segregation and condensation protein A
VAEKIKATDRVESSSDRDPEKFESAESAKSADDPSAKSRGNVPAEFESQLEDINIKLTSFEGPLDLLVHLIRKNQVNVYDIPIALVTEQYLAYLDLMQELNLDVASEFLVMAATLIHIKSRMLLPRPDPTLLDDPETDPRDALVQRLLEHQKFKAAAELLHDRETLRSAQWTRPDSRIEALVGEEYEPELEVDLFGLLAAFRLVLERARERPPVPLPPEQVSIETRIEQLLERLSETEACGFEDLFTDVATRGDMIVTFLALLEMIRLKLTRVFQSGPAGPIRIYKRARPKDAPHPIHDPEDEYKAHHQSHERGKGMEGGEETEGTEGDEE